MVPTTQTVLQAQILPRTDVYVSVNVLLVSGDDWAVVISARANDCKVRNGNWCKLCVRSEECCKATTTREM